MSTASAGLAKKNGYNNVRVYLDGEPAWMENRLPTYSTKEFILNGNVVLGGGSDGFDQFNIDLGKIARFGFSFGNRCRDRPTLAPG